MIKDRTRSILEAAIKDYIRLGKPITSERLYRSHDFGIKPAMIRWELNDLGEEGYLAQVHPSGGRVPTDKAYRFFVDEILESIEEKGVRPVTGKFLNYLAEGDLQDFVEDVSNHLKLFSVGYESEFSRTYQSGLRELFDDLEINAKRELLDIIRDFELMPRRLGEIKDEWEGDESWPKVFIGENPLIRNHRLSLIAEKIDVDGDDLLLLVIGPKRMDYQKSLRLFKSLKKSNGRKKR